MKNKSIKKTMLTIISIAVICCILCSCKIFPTKQSSDLFNDEGIINQSCLVGKWYNSANKCLDIRENGKYQLEDDYGLGSWTILDDKKTVEFTDFYGEILKSSVGKDTNGYYIDLNSSNGYYYKNAVSGNIDETTIQTGNIVIIDFYDFSDGRAWVGYKKDNTSYYYGLIDENGKILYSEPTSNVKSLMKPSGGLTAIKCDNCNKLIDFSGNVIMSSDNGEFDDIFAVGDGKAFVYKFNRSIDTYETLYGVVDSNGNWVQPLKKFKKFSDIDFYHYYDYAGDGFFYFEASGVDFFDSNSNNFFTIDINISEPKEASFNSKTSYSSYQYYENKKAQELTFKNGISLVSGINNNYDECYYIINSNGEYEETYEYYASTSGKLLSKDEDNDQIIITDYATGKKSAITEYPASRITNVVFSDDYGVITIQGVDYNTYFTVIDENGKIQFKPIICRSISSYASGKIVVENYDNSYSIYDESGNVLGSDLQYSCIGPFYNDIAVAQESLDSLYSPLYINSKGEKVLTTLTEWFFA